MSTSIDPSAVMDLTGAVFVIPLDAPIPGTVGTEVPSGDLYARLFAISTDDPESPPKFVPVSGFELSALAHSAWRVLCAAKRPFVLTQLPGAKYDVAFTQGARAIGLRDVAWPDIEANVAREVVEHQRTMDTKPWATERPKAGFPTQRQRVPVPVPTDEGDDYEQSV